MVQKTGIANLPLHYGQVPSWLANRMTKLGAIMSQAIIHHYGRNEFLRRLANPFWFQSLVRLWAWIGIHLALLQVSLVLLNVV